MGVGGWGFTEGQLFLGAYWGKNLGKIFTIFLNNDAINQFKRRVCLRIAHECFSLHSAASTPHYLYSQCMSFSSVEPFKAVFALQNSL